MVNVRSLVRSGIVIAVVVMVVLLGVGGYAAATFERPQVQSVEASWGQVESGTTQIQTEVVVENPNAYGVPGVVDVQYTAKLNDVVIARGSKQDVGLSPGTNRISINATMDNEAIAKWWVTHVNGDETSTLDIDATVTAPGGIKRTIDVRESTIETDMLGPMAASGSTTVALQGEPFLTISDRRATWGEATAQETPVTFSATVENRHDAPIHLDGFEYVIRMNDVTVGQGRTDEGLTVAPGETSTLSVRAAIDTPKMADWWATHVAAGERTNMTVELYGLIERDGELRRVPFALFERDLRFETDLLGGGGTSIEAVPDQSEGTTFEQPTVVGVDREWGEVTAGTTTVRSTVTVENPNEGRITEFVELSVGQRIAINDVVVANGSEDLGSLESGTNEFATTVAMDNSKVPQWWARHVNDGEQSTVRIQPRARADLGFTSLSVATEPRTSTVETDLLGGLTSDTTRPITIQGQRVGTIDGTDARWLEADTDTSPFTVSVTITNEAPRPMTVESLQYTMRMNDVTVADGVDESSYTIDPGETRTVEFTIVVDSQTMDEWWVSHVRNGETTVVDVDASATVKVAGQTDTVTVNQLTTENTVETDFLNASE